MSRIGNTPVNISEKVKVEIKKNVIFVEGPKGKVEHILVGGITAKIEENMIIFERKDDSRQQKAYHGLNRSLVNNMVKGVESGFAKQLHIIGNGYTAEVVGPWLKLVVGYSHDILMEVPENLEVKAELVPRSKGSRTGVQAIINVSGISKEEVGKFAAEIRKCRVPENYKGKGIRYSDEHVQIKAGKAGA
ncbi:MAG: 50S ribosomal protein L6 [Candidatus Cloacimonadota bacterium]|nr:50S ribosomal protein L6 [Candidatus Cloacimonadota bacterium]